MKILIRTIIKLLATPMIPLTAIVTWISEDYVSYKEAIIDCWKFIWYHEQWEKDFRKKLRGDK